VLISVGGVLDELAFGLLACGIVVRHWLRLPGRIARKLAASPSSASASEDQ